MRVRASDMGVKKVDSDNKVKSDKNLSSVRLAHIQKQRERSSKWRTISKKEHVEARIDKQQPDVVLVSQGVDLCINVSASDMMKILALFDDEVLFRACMKAPSVFARAILRAAVEKHKDEIYKLK